MLLDNPAFLEGHTTIMSSAAMRASRTATRTRLLPAQLSARLLQTRFTLIGAAALLTLLALLMMWRASEAYLATHEQFRLIVQDSAAKVDASESAIQAIASVDAQAASYIATAADSAIHWSSLQAVHDNFQAFRNQMFAVYGALPDNVKIDRNTTDPEGVAFNKVQYFAFDQFWQHIGNMLTAQEKGDHATAVQEYVIADNYLQNQIAPYLLKLDSINYDQMKITQAKATSDINLQTLLLAVPLIALAIGLTALSFWLRRKVRRVLTPTLDVAMVIGWLLVIAMLADLRQAPGQLDTMVVSDYYSVSASARALAYADQANSAQAGSVVDVNLANAPAWQGTFDSNKHIIEVSICGTTGCLATPFVGSGDQTRITPDVISHAKDELTVDKTLTGGIVPLVANVTLPGEAAVIEQARAAYQDYLTINAQIRDLLKNNNSEDAARLATGINLGQSAEAFARFSTSMAAEGKINHDDFDRIWINERDGLPLHLNLFGFGGCVLLIVLLIVGVYHRFREL